MIHYITTNGIGNAWVANELSRLDAAGVPFVLHALRKPEALFHGSDWAVRLNQRTRSIYPLPAPGLVLHRCCWHRCCFAAGSSQR
jgi:colanic acid/amylovoran biosynthesis glycosyltransferase